MRYGAALRSSIEAITALLLTTVLSDQSFASFLTEYYSVYFLTNLVFGAATVDMAGGHRDLGITMFLVALSLLVAVLLVFIQDNVPSALFFAAAIMSVLESVVFVQGEMLGRRFGAILLLAPRIAFFVLVSVFAAGGITLSLRDVLLTFAARDFILCFFGACLFFIYRGEFFLRPRKGSLTLGPVIYLLVSTAQDFVLRFIMFYMIDAAFLKEYEFALRLPRILQIGLMFCLRHRLFLSNQHQNHPLSSRPGEVTFIMLVLVSILTIPLAAWKGFTDPVLVLLASFFAAIAVPWYLSQLQSRRFLKLTFIQVLSALGSVFVAVVTADAYISVFGMLFLISAFCMFDRVFERRCGKES